MKVEQYNGVPTSSLCCVQRRDDLKSLTLLRSENLFFFVNGILLKNVK